MPVDIGSKAEGPSQPKLRTFPVNPNIFKRKTNHFTPTWYTRHTWIIYSILKDKVYCFPCIFFGVDMRENTFTEKGFNNWAHAIGDIKKGLDKHGNSETHITAVSKWEIYKNNPVTIEERLNPHRSDLVEKKRDYFIKIINYIR